MKDDKSCRSTGCDLCGCVVGITFGVVCGLGMLILGLFAMWCDTATPMVDLIAGMYWGYSATLVGSLVGFVWGFVYGFIKGELLVLVYKFLVNRCFCPVCKKK